MPLFEVQAIVEGKEVSHVAEYPSAEAAREANTKHLGSHDRIVKILELSGWCGDTRRLAAARLDQTSDDGFTVLD